MKFTGDERREILLSKKKVAHASFQQSKSLHQMTDENDCQVTWTKMNVRRFGFLKSLILTMCKEVNGFFICPKQGRPKPCEVIPMRG